MQHHFPNNGDNDDDDEGDGDGDATTTTTTATTTTGNDGHTRTSIRRESLTKQLTYSLASAI